MRVRAWFAQKKGAHEVDPGHECKPAADPIFFFEVDREPATEEVGEGGRREPTVRRPCDRISSCVFFLLFFR